MTIASEQSKVVYAGNGSTTTFPVPFRYVRDEDLEVILRGADGAERPLQQGGEYHLERDGDGRGGALVLVSAPQAGEVLAVRRDPPVLQETHYEEGVPLSAAARENALDLLTMIAQANRERIGRALLLPVSSEGVSPVVPAPEAGSVLAWGADGNLVNGPSQGEIAGAGQAAQSAADSRLGAEQARDQARTARDEAEAARDVAAALAGNEHNALAARDAAEAHPVSAIAGLADALAGKAAAAHGHALAQIAEAGTAAALDAGESPGNVPVIGADGKLPGSIAGGGGLVRREILTVSQDWTVPGGVDEVDVWVVGGGAPGCGVNAAAGDDQGGHGGGAGGCAYKRVSGLAPGQIVPCTVAAAVGGTTGSTEYGQSSSFGAYCSATGGQSYRENYAGGSGVGADANYDGAPGNPPGQLSGSGGGSPGPWGNGETPGVRASSNQLPGNPGKRGSGGSGGWKKTGAANGGAGGAGLIIIEYAAG